MILRIDTVKQVVAFILAAVAMVATATLGSVAGEYVFWTIVAQALLVPIAASEAVHAYRNVKSDSEHGVTI